MTRIEQIERLLDGIDRTEMAQVPGGWWETSAGEEKGAEILTKIRALYPLRNWSIEMINRESGQRQTYPRIAREVVKVDEQTLEVDGVPYRLHVADKSIAIGDVRLSIRQCDPKMELALQEICQK